MSERCPVRSAAKRAAVSERNDHIERLYQAGMSYRWIAEQAGMSLHGVYRVCHKKLCLPRRGQSA